MRIIPEDLISKIRKLELEVEDNPVRIASAICATKWGDLFWDKHLFFKGHNDTLTDSVVRAGLSGSDNGKKSVRGTDSYWLHFLSPIATYKHNSKLCDLFLNLLSLDPGIKVKEIHRNISPDFKYSFWYSVGGDRLQDLITGIQDLEEYRADVLGLNALTKFSKDPDLRLSDMTKIAMENTNSVMDDRFKQSEFYQLATQYINPLFGHNIVRKFANSFPFLCYNGLKYYNGLIPIDRFKKEEPNRF